MADQNVDGLIVAVKADLTDYLAKMEQMQAKTATTAESAAASLGGIGKSLGLTGAAFYTFSAKAIKSAMDWGNAVDDLSDKTGLAGEESSKLLLIAQRVGIGAGEAAGMFSRFARSANTAAQAQADAAVQGKKSTDAYSKLGITLLNSDGTLKDTATLFGEVKKAIMDMPDGLQKTAAEMELFGRSGAAMHDLLNMTETEMQAVIEKGRALGLVMSTEQAAAWEKFSRDVNSAKGTLSAVGITIGTELMPQIQNMLKELDNGVRAFKNMDPETKQTIVSVMKLGTEIGVMSFAVSKASGALSGIATALGIAGGAAVTAGAPFVALAIAIGLVTNELGEFIAKTNNIPDWMKTLLKGGLRPLGLAGLIQDRPAAVGSHDPEHDSQGGGAGVGLNAGVGNAYVGNPGGSAKTALETYLENLTAYKDIWQRQIELGQISQAQFKELLIAQLTGLEAISVGQDEQLSKERGIYDLKSLLRQADMALIAEQRAKSDRDFAAQTISERMHHEQRKIQIAAEIALTAAGSEKRYAKEKELIDLELQFADLLRNRIMTNIGYQQQLSNASISIEREQLQHLQKMQSIGAISITTDQLERNAAREMAILNSQYQSTLEYTNRKIAAYNTGYEKDKENFDKYTNEKMLLEKKYNLDSLAAANKLVEQKAELQRQTASEYSRMMTDLITGTRSGQDIMQEMWRDFVMKVIQKLLMINKVTNIVDSIIGGLFNTGNTKLNNIGSIAGVMKGMSGGGDAQANVPIKVGEFGEEIFVPTTSGKIIAHGAAAGYGSAASSPPIEVNVVNNTGTEATPTVSQSFDMGKLVVNIVMDAAERNVGGMGDMMRGMARR